MINLITSFLVKLIHRVRARDVPLQDPNYLSKDIWNNIFKTSKAARRETSARARSACVCATKMSLAAAGLDKSSVI